MSCEQVRPELGPFLTGALEPAQAATVEAHLESCSECGAELAALQSLAESLRVPAPAVARRGWSRLLLATAAAALLGVGAGVLLVDRGGNTTHQGGTTAESPRARVRAFEGEGHVGSKGVAAGGSLAVVALAVTAGVIVFEPPNGGDPVLVAAGQQVVAGATTAPEVGPISQSAATVAALEKDAVRLTAERDAAVQEREALRQELARAREELSAIKRPSAPDSVTVPGGPGKRAPRLSWGRWTSEAALSRIDWVEGAGAAKAIRDAIPDLLRKLDRGEQPSQEDMLAIAKHNQKLVAVELEAHGKLPSHAPGNGAYTHPAIQSNLIVEHLQIVGLPLSEAQELQVLKACQDYDQAWDQRQASYGAATLAFEKLLDELRLKREHSARLDAILDPAQRDALSAPEGKNVAQVDLYSPVLMLAGIAVPLPVNAPEQASAMVTQFAGRWGLTAEQLGTELTGRWAAASLERQTPVPLGRGSLYTVDQALQAGTAQLEAMRSLLARPDLPETARKALLADQGIAIPHLIAAQ